MADDLAEDKSSCGLHHAFKDVDLSEVSEVAKKWLENS